MPIGCNHTGFLCNLWCYMTYVGQNLMWHENKGRENLINCCLIGQFSLTCLFTLFLGNNIMAYTVGGTIMRWKLGSLSIVPFYFNIPLILNIFQLRRKLFKFECILGLSSLQQSDLPSVFQPTPWCYLMSREYPCMSASSLQCLTPPCNGLLSQK